MLINSRRYVIGVYLCLLSSVCIAQIHVCKHKDGTKEYTNTACPTTTKDITPAEYIESSLPAGGGVRYVGRRITIKFRGKSVGSIYKLLADVSGKELYIDDSANLIDNYYYVNQPWDQIADEIAGRLGLTVTYPPGRIQVQAKAASVSK